MRKLTRKRENQGFRQEKQERPLGGQKGDSKDIPQANFLDSGRWKHMTERTWKRLAMAMTVPGNICYLAENGKRVIAGKGIRAPA